jgi:hypothetical protein
MRQRHFSVERATLLCLSLSLSCAGTFACMPRRCAATSECWAVAQNGLGCGTSRRASLGWCGPPQGKIPSAGDAGEAGRQARGTLRARQSWHGRRALRRPSSPAWPRLDHHLAGAVPTSRLRVTHRSWPSMSSRVTISSRSDAGTDLRRKRDQRRINTIRTQGVTAVTCEGSATSRFEEPANVAAVGQPKADAAKGRSAGQRRQPGQGTTWSQATIGDRPASVMLHSGVVAIRVASHSTVRSPRPRGPSKRGSARSSTMTARRRPAFAPSAPSGLRRPTTRASPAARHPPRPRIRLR